MVYLYQIYLNTLDSQKKKSYLLHKSDTIRDHFYLEHLFGCSFI